MCGNWVSKSVNSLLIDSLLSTGQLRALRLCKHCYFFPLLGDDTFRHYMIIYPFPAVHRLRFFPGVSTACHHVYVGPWGQYLVGICPLFQELGTSKESPVSFCPRMLFRRAGTHPCNWQLTQKDQQNICCTQAKRVFHQLAAYYRYNSRRPTAIACHGERSRMSSRSVKYWGGVSLEQCQDNSGEWIVQLFCSSSRLLCLALNHISLCPVDLTGVIFMYHMDSMSVGINLVFINSITYCTTTSVASSQRTYGLI